MKSVRLSREANQELTKAAKRYESRQTGLAARFLDEIEAVSLSVARAPKSFPRLLGLPIDLEIRRALLHRFPYALVFYEMAGEIRVLAVAHSSRRPGTGSTGFHEIGKAA
jgi:toxin ParE1/3/4